MKRLTILSLAALAVLASCSDKPEVAVAPDAANFSKINSNDFYQCQTGNPRRLEAPPGPGCSWISGVLNQQHNVYFEDDVIPQSLALNEAVGKTRVILEYGLRKGGSDAGGDLSGPFNGNYDFMAHYAAGTGPNNPCTNGRLGPFCTGTSFKGGIPRATLAIPGPGDARVNTSGLTPTELAAYQTAFARYVTAAGKSSELEILGAAPGSIVLTSLSFTRSGDATIARMVFEFQAAQPDVLMLWGMHFAYGGDWNAGTPDGYWHGASGQSGSPFHTKLIEVRTNISGSNYATGKVLNNGAMAINVSGNVVVRNPQLGISKTVSAPTVSAGEPFSWTITLTNSGDGAASGAEIVDPLPAIEGYTYGTSSSGCTIVDGELRCGPTTLAAGASLEAVVNATATGAITPNTCGAFPNVATGKATGQPDVTANASITIECPDVSLTKEADAGTVSAGSQIGFTITVSNAGPGTATGVTVTDNLPAGFTWTIDPANPAWSITTGTLSFGPASLAAGASSSVHVVATTTSANCGVHPNTATATVGNGDDPAAAYAEVTVNCPAVSLSKITPSEAVALGQPIQFVVAISNTGEGDAMGVVVTDNLPTTGGLSPWQIVGDANGFSLNGSTLSFGPTTLLAGQTRNVLVQSSNTTAANCGVVQNTATATMSGGIVANSPAQAEVFVQCPAIALIKTGVLSANGNTITYSFTVTNTGNVTLTNVTLSDPLPNIQLSGGPIPSLAPGASDNSTFTGTYTVTQADRDAGRVDNTATTCGTPPMGPNVCDSDDETVIIPQDPGLSIVKLTNGTDNNSAPGPTVPVGSPVIWTYNVTNTGNVTLTNIAVTDDRVASSAISCTGIPGGSNVITSLAPNASAACSASGTAVAGQYANIGTATSGSTTASDPDHYFGQLAGDVCEDGKPRQLFMLYNGNGRLNDNHNQASGEVIIRVDDDATIANRQHPVTIRTYDHQDKVIQTFTNVAINTEIVFQSSKSGQLIPPRAGFRVFLAGANPNQPAQAIEHVQFHSSCSQPLAPGNEFGSFRLIRDAN